MKKTKRFAAVLLLMLLAFGMFGSFAYADNSYSIPNLSVDAVINPDGSMSVTETWTVNFISGTFTRFYHDISTDKLPADESFGAIRDVSVTVDGVECEFTDDTANRPDYHYNISSESAGAAIAVYLKSSECTRTYVISYTLDGLVKRVDGDYYLMVYRFVGKNFEKHIDTLNIRVTAPDGCSAKVLYKSNGSVITGGSTVSIKASSDGESMYKLRIRFDGGSIPGAVNIAKKDLSNSSEIAGSVFSLILKVLGALVALVVIYFVLGFIKDRNKAKKQLEEKGIGYIKELIMPLRTTFSPVELACALDYRGYAFLLQLLSMSASGRLAGGADDEGRQIIYIPTDSSGAWDVPETHLINTMSEYCAQSEIPLTGKGYALNLDLFADYVAENYNFAHNLNADLAAVYGDIVKVKKTGENAPLIEALRTAVSVAKGKNIIPVVDERMLLSSYADHETVLYYAASTFHGEHEYSGSDDSYNESYRSWYYFGDCYDKASSDYDAANSSDSGSGCSSCSSCSSCGGGGAD